MGSPSATRSDRVLVVAEPGERDLLELALEMAGYQVDVTDDGEAGLIIAAARTPVAAIIDLRVPVIDGCLLGESLRYVFREQIRLIAVTTRGAREERDRSREAGFDTHLVKPVSPNRVTQTLRQLLAHGHAGARHADELRPRRRTVGPERGARQSSPSNPSSLRGVPARRR